MLGWSLTLENKIHVHKLMLLKKCLEGMDMNVEEAPVATSADVKQATESLIGKVDALYIITDNTVVSHLNLLYRVANDQ